MVTIGHKVCIDLMLFSEIYFERDVPKINSRTVPNQDNHETSLPIYSAIIHLFLSHQGGGGYGGGRDQSQGYGGQNGGGWGGGQQQGGYGGGDFGGGYGAPQAGELMLNLIS